MAFNRTGSSSFSFQQEQVAYSYSSVESAPSTRHSVSSSARNASCSLSSYHPSSSSPYSSVAASPSSTRQPYPHIHGRSVNATSSPQPFVDSQFDIFEWHGQYQSCVRYFLDHAQYSAPVQAVAAFVNIQLPFQRSANPVLSFASWSAPHGTPGVSLGGGATPGGSAGRPSATGPAAPPSAFITLVPYIRRLIATAFDFPAVLHGFFGDDWLAGIGPIHETERRNYLFAAKSDNWLKVKADYDMDENQTVPFLRPLQNVSEDEIVNAEATWSEWLAMQDWMLGPRAPVDVGSTSGIRNRVNIKREEN